MAGFEVSTNGRFCPVHRGRVYDIEAVAFDGRGSFEARALKAVHSGDLESGLAETWRWLGDQAFSSTAAVFGSYVASVGLDDHATALRFVEAGLTANPHEWLLLNNRAFSLASLGRTDEAAAALSSIERNASDAGRTATLLATEGLILYRRGVRDGGFAKYSRAREMFEGEARDPRALAIATLLHAREETLANGEEALALLQRALELCAKLKAPEIVSASAILKARLGERAMQHARS